jgi:hypothetical protein
VIGDAANVLNAVRDPETLRRAPSSRRTSEDVATREEESIVSDLVEELRDPAKYQPRPAYAYFPPKTTSATAGGWYSSPSRTWWSAR